MSITGRDGYIVAKALYQACKYQERLKEEGNTLYERSDHQDMRAWQVFWLLWTSTCSGLSLNLEDEKRKQE